MKVALLTYQRPHLKTWQLLSALCLQGAGDMSLFGLPFTPRAPREPMFQHRPDMNEGLPPEALATHFGIPYVPVSSPEEIHGNFDYVLVGGAGLLPGSFVSRYRVVNCHPGLQPAVRGLDAFKWAIHDLQPVGVSLHLLDEEIDAGTHLKSVVTAASRDDTPETLARRHYELEIQLMAAFRTFADAPQTTLEGLQERPARMRMKRETEADMIARFPDWLREFGC